ESDPLEIFTDREGEIILKKYSPIGELSEFAKQYVESMNQITGLCICITDMDQVIAVSGSGKRDIQGKSISREMGNLLENREQRLAVKGENKYIKLFTEQMEDIYGQLICPIICEGDIIGGVVILQKDEKKKMSEVEIKLGQVAACFLGRQMEQ
ncbi:MAG: stage V sporulation T C-terminal domain-containing protein, partial [Lachnospiraceae bacterium]